MPKFQVVIPAGVSPGQSFHITLSDGKVFALMCPPGHGPGQTICFEIPEAPMPIPASTKTEDSSSKIKAPPQFTTRARSLSQLYRDGEKKAWADKALVMLAEELDDKELNLRIDAHGPKLLRIAIDLFKETDVNPTQKIILKHVERLCEAWKHKNHGTGELPKELEEYVEPARSKALSAYQNRLIELQTLFVQSIKPNTATTTSNKSAENLLSIMPQVQDAITKEIWGQLSSGSNGVSVYALQNLAIIMQFTNTRYNKVYRSIMKGIQGDDPKTFLEVKRAAAAISASCVKIPCRQSIENALDLIKHAVNLKKPFEDLLDKIANKVPGTFPSIGPVKKMYRLLEKTALRQENVSASPQKDSIHVDFKFGKICDIRRGYIQSTNMKQIAALLVAVQGIAASGEIVLMRIKDRFSSPSAGGWADIMINFYFATDPNRHICEIQFVHSHLMTARAGLGGHRVYGKGRAAAELLELSVKFVPPQWQDMIALLSLKSYIVANELDLSDEFIKKGGWKSWIGTDVGNWGCVKMTEFMNVVTWWKQVCMNCGMSWDSSHSRQCDNCDRNFCTRCKKSCMTKKGTRTWTCKDGAGCKSSTRSNMLRVDIIPTALSILRDFDVHAIMSARAFDGLEQVNVYALDLHPIRSRVNDSYIMAMNVSGIRALRLSKCAHITDTALKYLSESVCRNTLMYLDLRGCPKLSVDAIENLKSCCPLLESVERDSDASLLSTLAAAKLGGDADVAKSASENIKKNLINRTNALKSRFFGSFRGN